MERSLNSHAPVPPPPPKNWLAESILATIFCCMPLGIAGIVYAVQVNNKYADGDYEGAMRSSQEAGRFTKLSFYVSIGLIILSFIFVFALGGWAIMRDRFFDRY